MSRQDEPNWLPLSIEQRRRLARQAIIADVVCLIVLAWLFLAIAAAV